MEAEVLGRVPNCQYLVTEANGDVVNWKERFATYWRQKGHFSLDLGPIKVLRIGGKRDIFPCFRALQGFFAGAWVRGERNY